MPKREIALPCDCAGTCSVALVTSWEPDDLDSHGELWVEMYAQITCHGLRSRARVAWKVLRGRDPFTHGICLTGPAKVEGLRDFLTGVLNAYDAQP